MSMEWLKARAPGFSNLSDGERAAIVDFSLLWSLFESRILNTEGNAGRIRIAVDSWQDSGMLQAECYDAELDRVLRNRTEKTDT